MTWAEENVGSAAATLPRNPEPVPLPILLRVPRYTNERTATGSMSRFNAPPIELPAAALQGSPMAAVPVPQTIPVVDRGAPKSSLLWPRIFCGVIVIGVALAPTAVIHWPSWAPYVQELKSWLGNDAGASVGVETKAAVPEEPKPAEAKPLTATASDSTTARAPLARLDAYIVPLENGGAR